MALNRSATSDRTLAAIAALYDAAFDEALWPEALAQLTSLTDSQASTFWILDSGSRSLHPAFVSINFDQSVVDDYLGGIARLDPTVRYLLAHPKTAIVHDGMLELDQDDDTRRYMDWHERSVETRYRLVAQSELGPELQAGVALHRARRAGRYDPIEIDHFGLVNEHLRRALAIGVKLGSIAARQQLTADLLDRNISAIVLLDASRRVVFTNRAAEEVETQHDGIRISSDGIHLAAHHEDEHLRKLITRVTDSQRSQRSFGEVMRATRPSGRRPYGIWVAGVAQSPVALTAFRPAVWVVISDPERSVGPPMPHLQALFGLTQAEARLAVSLAAGESLQAAAEELGITYGTARTRLVQLFQKTDTRSQGQLIQLLLRCLPAVEIA
jgi:DNA-binding CsgD family transcriptional regulator/PAS domain-containing protein